MPATGGALLSCCSGIPSLVQYKLRSVSRCLSFLFKQTQTSDKTIMSEDEDMNEYPDFVQIGKNSPSHESLPSRENSVILEARDLKKSVGMLFIFNIDKY